MAKAMKSKSIVIYPFSLNGHKFVGGTDKDTLNIRGLKEYIQKERVIIPAPLGGSMNGEWWAHGEDTQVIRDMLGASGYTAFLAKSVCSYSETSGERPETRKNPRQ